MKGLKLTFANVGYGEAILIQAEDPAYQDQTFTMIIDGGSGEPDEFEGSTTGRRPFIDYLKESGISHVDLMVNTHIHEDHTVGLLPLAKEYKPDRFWQTLPVDYYKSMKVLDREAADTVSGGKFLGAVNAYREICLELESRGCRIEQTSLIANQAREGQGTGEGLNAGSGQNAGAGCGWISLAKDLKVMILAPVRDQEEMLLSLMNDIFAHMDDESMLRKARNRADADMNNLSVILMLDYKGKRILLPGDTNFAGYKYILKTEDPEKIPDKAVGSSILKADIFKVGHHGQKDGIGREVFRLIRPDYVVCCASSDRRYLSAAPQILAMMQEEGAGLYYSDCPDVPPYTDGLKPHKAVSFVISPEGDIRTEYETDAD
ncbi:MAG: ComEC/Rec2 family competence protein [Lachnospiraceae bacterium]